MIVKSKVKLKTDHKKLIFDVSALETFFGPLNMYAILDTNPGLDNVYLVDILLFYFTFYTTYYLLST